MMLLHPFGGYSRPGLARMQPAPDSFKVFCWGDTQGTRVGDEKATYRVQGWATERMVETDNTTDTETALTEVSKNESEVVATQPGPEAAPFLRRVQGRHLQRTYARGGGQPLKLQGAFSLEGCVGFTRGQDGRHERGFGEDDIVYHRECPLRIQPHACCSPQPLRPHQQQHRPI